MFFRKPHFWDECITSKEADTNDDDTNNDADNDTDDETDDDTNDLSNNNKNQNLQFEACLPNCRENQKIDVFALRSEQPSKDKTSKSLLSLQFGT